MTRALTIAALWLLPSAAAAQMPDIVSQDVAVDITSPELDVTIDAVVTTPDGVSGMYVVLPTLPIGEATVDGRPLGIEPHPDYPFVALLDFGTVLAPGETARIHMTLAGTPACRGPGYSGCAYEDGLTALFPVSEQFGWYLYNLSDLGDLFSGSITVRAPDGERVLAGPSTMSTMEPGGDGTTRWTFPLAADTSGLFVYSRATDWVEPPEGRLTGALPPGADEAARARFSRMLEVGDGLLPVYERRFGALPVDEVHVLAIPPRFPFAGLGLLGNVMVADPIFTPDYEYLVEQGIAHELAHSWWGNLLVATEPDEGTVIQEGMAEYSAWLGLGELQGDDVRTAGARMNSVWYMYGRPGDADVAPLAPEAASSPVAIHVGYHKAAQAWRAMAEEVGEDGFTSALATLVARGRTVTVADLVDEVQAETGHDLTRAVDQWLRATGFPRITVASAHEGAQQCLDITVEGDFDLHLPVAVRAADGSLTEQAVDVAPGSSHTCLDAVGAAAIEVDPRWTMTRLVQPGLAGDVTLDGELDAADLMAVALHVGTAVPPERRRDGGYDPLYDVDADRDVDAHDLDGLAASL